ncbi:hypothetical protein BU17DRAFT_68645 [Hysterangium stoloniferum]|nr:hypothetical protein BU17DRAFT_68645 [Hysterangium stoloniferum]
MDKLICPNQLWRRCRVSTPLYLDTQNTIGGAAGLSRERRRNSRAVTKSWEEVAYRSLNVVRKGVRANAAAKQFGHNFIDNRQAPTPCTLTRKIPLAVKRDQAGRAGGRGGLGVWVGYGCCSHENIKEPRLSSIGLPVLLPAMFLQIAKNRQVREQKQLELMAVQLGNVLRRPAGQQHYAETKAWQGGRRRDERQ